MTTVSLDSTVRLLTGHEFNTPLNGIMGFAQIAKIEIEEGRLKPKDGLKYINYIIKSAERLNSLIERLRLWTSLEDLNSIENASIYEIDYFLLNDLVLSLKNKHYPNVDLFNNRVNGSTNFKKTFFGSEYLVRNALLEVIDNAFKFSINSSSVSIVIEEDEHSKQSILIITNACHNEIEAQLLERYTPYSQFYRKKYEQQGIGLGLAIANKIFSLNGYQIRFSQPKLGVISTKIYFPCI